MVPNQGLGDWHRLRVLLYAGKPNWTLHDTLTPPETRSAG